MTTFLVVALALIAALLVTAATRPDHFRIERDALIPAPPEVVFGLLNDFHEWQRWSPWEGMDPQMQRNYSGADRGVGAVYAWQGNKKVGEGRMEIRESAPATRLVIQLDFFKPFEAHNIAEFTLRPEAAGTRVNWAMHGPSPFISKLMGLVFNFDRMVGKDFERGLANLAQASAGGVTP